MIISQKAIHFYPLLNLFFSMTFLYFILIIFQIIFFISQVNLLKFILVFG